MKLDFLFPCVFSPPACSVGLEGAQKPNDFTAFALRSLTGTKQVDTSPAMAERVTLAGSNRGLRRDFRRQHWEQNWSVSFPLSVGIADTLRNAQIIFSGFVPGFQVCRRQQDSGGIFPKRGTPL